MDTHTHPHTMSPDTQQTASTMTTKRDIISYTCGNNKSGSMRPSYKRFTLLLIFTLLTFVDASFRLNNAFDATPTTDISFERIVRRLAAKDDVSKPKEECKAVEECGMCTFGDQKMYPVCRETGRRQRYECTTVTETEDGEYTNEKTDTRNETRSCKRTSADEEFAMIRFQVFCFLIGAMALTSVRRQKRIGASLFDQRKIGAQQKPRERRSSDAEEEMVEFIRVDQESVPLVDTSSNPLEVI